MNQQQTTEMEFIEMAKDAKTKFQNTISDKNPNESELQSIEFFEIYDAMLVRIEYEYKKENQSIGMKMLNGITNILIALVIGFGVYWVARTIIFIVDSFGVLFVN